MRATLDSEERTHLQKLQTEEQGVLNGLAESEKELAQQAWEVRELISDVRHRLQGSTVAMLQVRLPGVPLLRFRRIGKCFLLSCAALLLVMDLKDPAERCQLLAVKKPRTFPKNQRIVFQAPDLKGILQLQQGEWREKKLGLGLSDQTYFNTHFNFSVLSYQPKRGSWVIGLQDKFKNSAFGGSDSSNPWTAALSPTVPPSHVGVYLDSEALSLSVYDVIGMGFSSMNSLSVSFLVMFFHVSVLGEVQSL
ncbi:PREDICTED: tripartite motif-containing protein 5-like [Chinchilla lanigera]|uniref:tripartite motif-containing protein 5-like n=1 Tax=Chinchilla lanigera TaxID=34839 RepID=UPI0006965FAB|nr:PREDICTED: tripartite motif-containing protein 5-like [Chinchilla lanigera]